MLFNKLNMTMKRISNLENMPIGMSRTKMEIEKKIIKNTVKYSRTVGQFQRYNICVLEYKKERIKKKCL